MNLVPGLSIKDLKKVAVLFDILVSAGPSLRGI